MKVATSEAPWEEGAFRQVAESGFDRLPASRRAEAYRMNDGGWTQQMANLRQYLEPAG